MANAGCSGEERSTYGGWMIAGIGEAGTFE